jgi:hypothetical protein
MKHSAVVLVVCVALPGCVSSAHSSSDGALPLRRAANRVLALDAFSVRMGPPKQQTSQTATYNSPHRLLIVDADHLQQRTIGTQTFFEFPNRRGFFFKEEIPVRSTIGYFLAPLQAARAAASVTSRGQGKYRFSFPSVAGLTRGRGEATLVGGRLRSLTVYYSGPPRNLSVHYVFQAFNPGARVLPPPADRVLPYAKGLPACVSPNSTPPGYVCVPGASPSVQP